MSKSPGGITAHINCMIISGFPGIGKTSTYNEMKKSFIGARCVDMDVRDYGTTNGIDVEDPAAYVNKVEKLSKENACIFVTMDRRVRLKLQEAHLFYIVVAPEFPPAWADQIPGFKPNPLTRVQYMKRFSESIGYNSLCAQTLDGKGYDDALMDICADPMPHFISPVLNKAVVDQMWQLVEGLTRQTFSQEQLKQMAGGIPMPPMSGPAAPPTGGIVTG